MRKFIVEYLLLDKDVERLEKITEEYRKLGLDTTIEKEFAFIMKNGSSIDIDTKLKFHERKLGLIED